MRVHRADRKQAGFTLVEILAVMAILGLLFTLAMPMIGKVRASGNLRKCQNNLRQIAMSLQNYVDERNRQRWPKESGVKFMLVLARDGEIRGEAMDIFVCPGTDDVTWYDDSDAVPGRGFEDWDNIDTSCISYAGRDNKTYPLNKNRLSEEIIAADDNEGFPNHEHITNFVYADSRVSQVDVKDFREELPEDAECVPVGPESPHEGLAKLLIDY
jgi:prepilin-type N-terminal cleavage/methylation domain-containing protein